jgi:hypothetical protein
LRPSSASERSFTLNAGNSVRVSIVVLLFLRRFFVLLRR